jgi:hypothetical protein
LRDREPAPLERRREQHGIAHPADGVGRVAPQGAASCQSVNRIRVVLEAGEVHDGVTVNGHCCTRGRACGETAGERHDLHRRVMVEIPERVDRRHREPGGRGRLGGRARRNAGDEEMCHPSIRSRARAAAGEIT